ncbi:MAG: ABC transporter permease [Gemmatimonadetes bacterium]|nr:ABC transporter permease [Gemmatimonadota bacterium]MBT5056524.1 ABC transporter permease [Gemmatimonadota bacterium]MBT5145294.1 ABC transporter permease [Gemmatimonadota bacterium]MBT5588238.1 ABC transporter permease [Gemmatimonadota bacterium]MBT5965268.1 ABC transporter permease [Gemmatimonadota bacterium]
MTDPSAHSSASGAGYWKLVGRQFARNRLALYSLVALGLLATFAAGADLIAGNKPLYMEYKGKVYFPAFRQYLVHTGIGEWPKELRRRKNLKRLRADVAVFPPIPWGPSEIVLGQKYQSPGPDHLLGTDRLGRDVLAGIIHGSRYALVIGLVSVSISLLIGVVLGAMAGYFGGWTDLLLSRLFELWSAIPAIFLIITAAAFFPPSLFFIMIIIGLTGWVTIARLTRSQFLHVRNYEYVEAARALGCATPRVIWRHILPNAIAPVLVPATFGVGLAILAESGLSFLGIGVPAETITWGAILAGARSNAAAWWLAVAPGLAIFFTVTLYNLVGDGLRDALDPKMPGADS